VTATKHPVEAAPAAPVHLNRELSQLDLIRRVLDLAADPAEPLLERVKFCGIVSSILDEFFMVRVAGLQDQVVSGASVRTPDGRTPQQTLADVRGRVLALTAEQTRLWQDVLRPALAGEGIRVGTIGDASDEELAERPGSSSGRSFPSSRRSPSGRGSRSPTSRGCRSASACSSATRRRVRSASPGSRSRKGSTGSCRSGRAG